MYPIVSNNDKSCACPDCGFEACDPASVLRHRKNFHGYIPRSGKSKSTHPPIDTSSSSSLTSSINELEFVPHAISPTQVTQPWGEMSPSENGAAPDMDSIFESHWQESQLIHYYNTWLAYIDWSYRHFIPFSLISLLVSIVLPTLLLQVLCIICNYYIFCYLFTWQSTSRILGFPWSFVNLSTLKESH